VEHLRLLRRRSGMTLATLAGRTSYSKSSWERYLNGKALPPRQAVQEFARAVSVKPDRLLVLLDVTEREQEGKTPENAEPEPPEPRAAPPGAAPSAEETPAPAGEPAAAPRRWRAIAWAGTALGMLAGLVAGMLMSPGSSSGKPVTKAGVAKCVDFECRNKDAQRMDCHIGVWTAAAEKIGSSYLELRYSPGCRAAWARITEAQIGDTARVEGPHDQSAERSISYDKDTYSPMLEAPYPAAVRACAVLKDKKTEVCTPYGGASPLPAAVTDERNP
jgi:transcriptional regulator with XRE-family HTH domain